MSGLIEKLQKLKTDENEAIADIVRELSYVLKDESYREAGYSSLFSFLTTALGYSEGAAYRRMKAAYCMQTNPDVYRQIRDGEISLCALAEIGRVKDSSEQAILLKEAKGKSKLEVQKLTSQYLEPQQQRRETIRAMPPLTPSPQAPTPLFDAPETTPQPEATPTFSITLHVDEEFIHLLEEAKKYVSHTKNSEVIERALKALIQSETKPVAKRKFKKPLKRTRFIRTSIRQEVRNRDGNQCTFVSDEGVRCCETKTLQFDHVQPFAKGGKSEASNLRLLCRTHNGLEAEKHFGKHCVKKNFHCERSADIGERTT